MFSVLCPICHFVNPADATRCKACNAAFFEASGYGDLADDVESTLGERRGLGTLSSSGSAALTETRRTDDAHRPSPEIVRPAPPPSESSHRPTTGLPSATSASLQELPPLTLIDPVEPHPIRSADSHWAGSAPQTVQTMAWPPLMSPDLGFTSSEPPAVPPSSSAGNDEAARRLMAKSMARQAARRARMASSTSESQTPASKDVLLLDPDKTSRQSLAALLDRFGFSVHEASDVEHATKMAADRIFAAAFMDIALEGTAHSAGAALCERLQRRGAGSCTAVVLMASQVRPADRVRAALARSDLLLVKPLTRGDVARALESCSVVLPVDERRG